MTTESKYTKLALTFLAKRNPFDDVPQSEYVFALMEFEEKKGEEALQALAGFYVYAIDNKIEILSTFAHDLNGRNDEFLSPRSSRYLKFWIHEVDKPGIRHSHPVS